MTVQPALDGTIPNPPAARQRADDYDTWLNTVWPAFTEAAASGRTFTTYEIAEQHKLPDPPNPQAHWGRLMTLLKEAGYVRKVSWANSSRPTTHHSGVRTWKGTASARRGAAA